jgi:hypothetical protein
VTPRGFVHLCPAALAIVAARVWVRVAPGHAVRWASRSTGPIFSRASTSVAPASSVAFASRAIAALGARRPFLSTCLEQSLALVMLLTAMRIPSRLVIGVSRRETLNAHAWVEHNGSVVLGAAHVNGLEPLSSPVSSPCRG